MEKIDLSKHIKRDNNKKWKYKGYVKSNSPFYLSWVRFNSFDDMELEIEEPLNFGDCKVIYYIKKVGDDIYSLIKNNDDFFLEDEYILIKISEDSIYGKLLINAYTNVQVFKDEWRDKKLKEIGI